MNKVRRILLPFDSLVDPNFRPHLSCSFEKQVVDSQQSRNPNAPSWKDNFVLYAYR